MNSAIDFAMLSMICAICWRGYRYRQPWFCLLPHILWHKCRGRGLWRQLLLFGPVVVGWLLFCHYLNAHGWHATAAGGMVLAMTLGLEAMRRAEERQKRMDI
ncbi:MAG: hypothetical protein R8K50_10680 [Mariprofundus sp.]